ncbi:hypothetical protein FFK22_019190 [Mycobacterium sp. KBS0706]|uniref:hypothetical protein n=1 Tax=Mycobacterium sp. KBS0706 TaxID=2578109 RepID=UPI00110FC306|nr:hypothetical protein [Mycobacterium sp. KBS0706]TSD87017.1 hypothetical protein FFK22_019190 [Mycobacterium sp. KBS0706]
MRAISIPDAAMENYPWQIRAKKAGLTQRLLARLLGHHERTVSSQLRGHWQSGVPQHVKAAIIVWEMLAPEQRQQWLAAVEHERAVSDSTTADDGADTVSIKQYRILEKKLAKLQELNKKLAKP